MRRFFLLFLCLGAFSKSSFVFAQKNVDVDLLTGTANVTIPVDNIQVGDISVPLFYYYRAGGIKVEDYDQRMGLGWQLSIDAGITRILHGFPDDMVYQANTGYPAVKGWLQSGATDIPSKIENFSIAGGITTGTCANEVSDYSYMNTNFPYYYDTEPDEFMVSAPGLNLKFVFDKTGTIRTIPFQDVKILKSADGSGKITSFTIINSNGLKYVFDKADTYEIHVDDNINTSTLPAFSRTYLFYKRYTGFDSYLPYTEKWCLASITDTKLNKIQYNYDVVNDGPAPKANQKIEILKYNPSTSQFDETYLYALRLMTTIHRLNNIIASDVADDVLYLPGHGDVEFTWEGTYSESKLTNIKIVKIGRNITPVYSGKFCGNNNTNSWGRYFLMGLNFSGVGISPGASYTFSYQDVDDNAHTSYCTFSGNDSINNAQDYWGYFNGAGGPTGNTNLNPPVWVYPDNSSVHIFKINAIPGYSGNVVPLPGANRSVTSSVTAGTLTKIIYPAGGTTSFSYDNQEYFDNDLVGYISPATDNRVKGGGVRIRSITNNDGISGTNETTYYDYDDASGYTSGRAISVPSFTFVIPNSTSYSTITDKVYNSTYRTFYNFADESASVIYGVVTVRKTNGGKSVYEFNTDGVWGGNDVYSGGNLEWHETMVYATRNYTSAPSPCNAIAPDFLKNNKNNYPFPPNPDFDFQRGLLTKATNYNEPVSGVSNKISEESYTYTRSHTTSSSTNPETMIQALKFDDISGGAVRGYAKYNVISSVTNLLAQKVTKIYTTKTPYEAAAYTTETENYTYLTTGEHRLPVQVSKTNSDGTTFNSYFQYVKDYQNPSSSGDVYSQALYAMQAANENERIEIYQSVTPGGGTEKIIAGDITAYKPYYNSESGQYMNMPYEKWKFASQAGLSTSPASFKSGISGSTFQKNSGYIKTTTIDDYDYDGNPDCITSSSRVSNSVIFDPYNDIKVAEFGNAKNSEVIYASFDFNNVIANGVNGYSGTDIALPGRKSPNCLNLTTGLSVYRTVSNAATNTNMIFSCWIKDAASAGTLTVNLSTTGFSANYTISFTSNSNWTYYEIKIPKPNYSNYSVNISTSAALKIDDILFYPGNASVKTHSYDTFTSGGLFRILPTAETGSGGSTMSYEYDTYGRPYLARDGFNNIIEVKTYKLLNNW